MITRAGHRAATAPVVDQRVACLLKHALLVANDDLGRAQFQQPLEAVVTIDNAAVQIIQVGGSEATTIKLYHWTQVGRQDRQHREDHPFRRCVRLAEGFHDLQALGCLLAPLAHGRADFLAQPGGQVVQVDVGDQFAHRLGAHAGAEDIAKGFLQLAIAILLEQIHLLETFQVAPELLQSLPRLVALALKLRLRGIDLPLVLQAQTIHFAPVLKLRLFEFAPRLLDDSVAGGFGDAFEDFEMLWCNDIALFDDYLVGWREDDIVFSFLAHRLTQGRQRIALGLPRCRKILLAALLDLLAISAGEALLGLPDGAVTLRAQAVDALNNLAVHVLLQFRQFLIQTHEFALARLLVNARNHVERKVEDALQITRREVEQKADAAGCALEVPDMAHRRCQFDMAHALAAYL